MRAFAGFVLPLLTYATATNRRIRVSRKNSPVMARRYSDLFETRASAIARDEMSRVTLRFAIQRLRWLRRIAVRAM